MEQTEAGIYLPENYKLRYKLLEERKIFLWGPVEDINSRIIVEQLLYLEAQQAGVPVHLYINSPGGMVTGGNAIYDLMQAISSPVYTYCIGLAASMASILLSGGAKGNRYIYPKAEVMIHQPSMGGFQGNSADIEINARQVIKAKEQSAATLAANCGQTKEKVLKDFDRDYWMTAGEAIAYGIVDQVMPA